MKDKFRMVFERKKNERKTMSGGRLFHNAGTLR
jgi:hypothetical protein